MERIPVSPRDDWRETAEEHGFTFHSIDGDPYWDESAYYRFNLKEIEEDLEDPAEKLEEMCFEIVTAAIADEELLRKLAIPEDFWDVVADSWTGQQRNLYGRMDFAYDGRTPLANDQGRQPGPAKLYEYNADTPTSLYESAIFQWVWLEQAMERNLIPESSDQFNSLHERLIDAFGRMGIEGPLHLAAAQDSEEDWGTIEYLEECAKQAGQQTKLIDMDDIGLSKDGWFTDADDEAISTMFKLYPWEWMLKEEFAQAILDSNCVFIEPAWKSILSNKGLMPLLWERFTGHPNLLPAYFDGDPAAADLGDQYVRKPLFSREGWNVEIIGSDDPDAEGSSLSGPATEGPYGEEGFILQAYHPLPDVLGKRPMCGVWLVASEAAGMCIREDTGPITSDDAHFIPHIILD
jgi:glutathionylspermidine synthase